MVKLTVFGDLHYDELPNGKRQLDNLMEHIARVKPDFIVSLGDLCKPTDDNKKIVIERLDSLGIPVYHTIGNHETDDCELEKAIDFLSMESPYYSFEYEDLKFIVLNTCYFSNNDKEIQYYGRNYREENSLYPIIPKDEIEWLNKEIREGKKSIIFSHHSLINDYRDRGVSNRKEIQKIFDDNDNVILCMNGHDHGDDYKNKDGISYYTVNSSGYVWCGFQIWNSEELNEKYGYTNGFLFYEDVLYVDVEIDEGTIRITGVTGKYESVTPEDVELNDYVWNGVSIKPQTSSVTIKLKE